MKPDKLADYSLRRGEIWTLTRQVLVAGALGSASQAASGSDATVGSGSIRDCHSSARSSR